MHELNESWTLFGNQTTVYRDGRLNELKTLRSEGL